MGWIQPGESRNLAPQCCTMHRVDPHITHGAYRTNPAKGTSPRTLSPPTPHPIPDPLSMVSALASLGCMLCLAPVLGHVRHAAQLPDKPGQAAWILDGLGRALQVLDLACWGWQSLLPVWHVDWSCATLLEEWFLTYTGKSSGEALSSFEYHAVGKVGSNCIFQKRPNRSLEKNDKESFNSLFILQKRCLRRDFCLQMQKRLLERAWLKTFFPLLLEIGQGVGLNCNEEGKSYT